MEATDLAWSAGIIDGEGCLSLMRPSPSRAPNSYALLLKVTMGHLPTIERLHDLFEVGSIQVARPSRAQRRFNTAYSWLCTTRQVGVVLGMVRPYLVTKAGEADLALEYLALPVMPGTRRVSEDLAAERLRIFVALRDAKPSARFRAEAS